MYVFFSIPNWPKIGIFLSLGSAQLSPPPPIIFFQESRPWVTATCAVCMYTVQGIVVLILLIIVCVKLA